MMQLLERIAPNVIAAAMRGYEEAPVEKYSPDQPRDEQGRFGEGGGSSSPEQFAGKNKEALDYWTLGRFGEDDEGEMGNRYESMRDPSTKEGRAWLKALDKLPDYEGVVFHGTSLDAAGLSRYQKGYEYSLPLTSSSSKSTDIAQEFADSSSWDESTNSGSDWASVIFETRVSSGKDISKAVELFDPSMEKQQEVILKARTKFRVTEVINEGTVARDSVKFPNMRRYRIIQEEVERATKLSKSAIDLSDLEFSIELAEDDDLLSALAGAFETGSADAAAAVGVDLRAPSDRAMSYSRERGAELVGMRRKADGSLVRNPNPKWAITETIRDDARSLVETATSEGWSKAKLADALQDIFTEARAHMIARTELGFAYNGAVAETYEEQGVDYVEPLDGDGCLPQGHDDKAPEPDGEVGVVDLLAQVSGQIWPVSAIAEHPLGHPNCVRSFPIYYGPRPADIDKETEE